jgi:hypothetical protein
VLVAVDVAVLVLVLGAWLVLRGDDPAANVVNDGLRGSRPPADQAWPALDAVDGIEPGFPSRAEVQGAPAMLVATCVECRSGDIIGGFLGRLPADALPEDARVVVLTWGGSQLDWAMQWRIDRDRFELVDAKTDGAIDDARRTLGIGPVDGAEESGIAYLHDADGAWRSTFFLGQLDRDDVAHDLAALGA